ncbi:MAG TPA: metallophosphoesterase [Erysipelothrix sp.]
MKFIVCSDNHGDIVTLRKIVEKHPDASAYLHCGDIELESSLVPEFKVVRGNNDYFYNYPEQIVTTVGDLRVLITHSHLLPFGNRIKALSELAQKHQCDIACFGHTHRYQVEYYENILCINPGSLYYNRDGSKPSYAVVTVEKGEINVQRMLAEDLF